MKVLQYRIRHVAEPGLNLVPACCKPATSYDLPRQVPR